MKVKSLLGLVLAVYGAIYLALFAALALGIITFGYTAAALMVATSTLCLANAVLSTRIATLGWSQAAMPVMLLNIFNPLILPVNLIIAVLTLSYYTASSYQQHNAHPSVRRSPRADRRRLARPALLGPNPARLPMGVHLHRRDVSGRPQRIPYLHASGH